MKKNIGIAAFMIPILTVSLSGCGKAKAPDDTNASRRDDTGQVSDADLSMVDGAGVEGPGVEAVEAASKNPENVLQDSIIQDNFNSPVTEDVQVVRTVLIPEAVTMGDGDAGAFYSNEDYKDVVPVDIASFSADDIPEKYDSRNVDGKSFVTPVKDQGYSYLCWTYACMGAIESDILSHHDEIKSTDVDLSEKHLAYYNLHKAEGSLGGLIDDDYRELVNADGNSNDWIFDYDTGYITSGGVNDYCISLLTAWKGPVKDAGDDSFASLYGSTNVFTDNNAKPSGAFTCDYHVQGTYEMPGNINNNLMIKQMVMEHGAATVGVCAAGEYFKDHSSNLYSTFNGNPAKTADHEVLIIGWDDNYSATNFRYQPEGDGAWLCRNSWGTGSGQDGCFYLSYYDETTAISNATAYDVVLEGEDKWYDNNYQAAGFFTTLVSTLDDDKNMVSALSGSTNPFGMLYEAQGSEELRAVGLMNLDLYQQYEIDIYVNPSDGEGDISFEKDLPALTQKVSAISGGYHTFELEEPISLDKGDSFFVLIKPATSGRLVFEPQEDMTGDANFDEWQNLTGNVHNSYKASGCSYYISDDGESMIRQDDKDFFVKAYTNNR